MIFPIEHIAGPYSDARQCCARCGEVLIDDTNAVVVDSAGTVIFASDARSCWWAEGEPVVHHGSHWVAGPDPDAFPCDQEPS